MKKKLGRPVNIEMIRIVQELRKKGKKFREIQKITGKSLKSLSRWVKLPLGKSG